MSVLDQPRLDLGIHTDAQHRPMAAADFGAEAGAYALRSENAPTPLPPVSPPTISCALEPSAVGAQVGATCTKLAADTFLACSLESVTGTAQDTWRLVQGKGEPGVGLGQIVQKNGRYLYLIVLVLVLVAISALVRLARR